MKLVTAIVVSVCLTLSCVQGQHDQTVQSGATGASVVEAVCSRIEASCVFSDDKLLTRRLSYVESHDGSDPDTFRMTYFGGIWQVDQYMFDVTQSTTARSYLQTYINKIKTAFGIDWLTITWEDLTKPLYSGLGARLYLEYNSRNNRNGIPRSIDEQGDYWVQFYRPQSTRSVYVTEANRLEQGCSGSNGADIVFVLDESGSVGSSNFEKMKNFVVDVVKGYDVGPGEHQYRIGMIKYSTTPIREFDLKTHQTQSAVINAVKKMKYKGGNTYTNLALDEMVTKSFITSNGARPIDQGHPRIGIVVTDGQSNNPPKTATSARKAHDADITVFSVGVGSGVNLQELDAIASAPVCLHVMLLQGFTEFESLKYAIEQRTCEAPIIISPGKNSTTGGRLPAGGDQNCKIKVPAEGITIELTSSTGKTTFFTSKSTYPSSEYFEEKVEATPGRMGVLFIPQPPTTEVEAYVFCNIKGDNNTESNITIGSNPGDHNACKNKPCKHQGVCISTPGGGYQCQCKEGYTGQNCEIKSDVCKPPTPCKHGSCVNLPDDGYQCVCHKHFTGVHCETKIRPCDSNPCQNGGTCEGSSSGGSSESSGDSKMEDEESIVNPIRSSRLQSLKSVIAEGHKQLLSKDRGFSCRCTDEFTGPLCETAVTTTTTTTTTPTTTTATTTTPTTTSTTTTTATTTTPTTTPTTTTTATTTTTKPPNNGRYNCQDKNPCTQENRDAGKFYFPHDNDNMFVQCDNFGKCFEMTCAPGLVWDTAANACNWPQG